MVFTIDHEKSDLRRNSSVGRADAQKHRSSGRLASLGSRDKLANPGLHETSIAPIINVRASTLPQVNTS